MLEILLAKNFIYLRSQGLKPTRHSHIAPQVSAVSKPHTLRSGDLVGQGIYFASEVPHAISSNGIMHSFMINPVYGPARMLARIELKELVFKTDEAAVEILDNLKFVPAEHEIIAGILDKRLLYLVGRDIRDEPLDGRIAEAVNIIDELETKRVAAGDLAETFSLSESRFLHLFKDELKMTMRKYLVWRRTIDGACKVIEGNSITEAAHEAGFTDSAHFAKTFKQMFGFTLSGLFGGTPKPVLLIHKG